jgi:hypothetical protein
MADKKRRYYGVSGDGLSSPTKKIFLLKFQNLDDEIEADGPFIEQEANERLKEYLAKGVCSWLVSYNE